VVQTTEVCCPFNRPRTFSIKTVAVFSNQITTDADDLIFQYCLTLVKMKKMGKNESNYLVIDLIGHSKLCSIAREMAENPLLDT
jgi:hypothetical protein